MVNPHFTYAFAFTLALALYPLGWSSLYPSMSFPTTVFIATTIAAHLIAGIVFRKRINVRAVPLPPLDVRLAGIVTVILYLLWVAEFIYGNGIPFVEILLQRAYDYKIFGIPHLHVFIVTFGSFFTVLLFHHYLATGARKLLFLCVVNLVAAILIYNRGMFLFNVAACSFLYLIYKPITFRQTAFAVVATFIILFLFGMMGSMRVSNESRVAYTNEGFLESGGATEVFRESAVPKELFWTYVYATSPLANLEVNISSADEKSVSATKLLDWTINEVLPDFISKRVSRFTDGEQIKIKTIPGPFNATTVYAGSFSRIGWCGLVLMMIITLLAPWLYARIVCLQSPYFLSGFVILNTIFLFMIFENTLRFTGFSLQLAYPVLLTAILFRTGWRHIYLLR